MTGLLTTREALAAALCSAICKGDAPVAIPDADNPRWHVAACFTHQRAAIALFASGTVHDISTLADDEALVERVWSRCGNRTTPEVLQIFRALAAVLTQPPADDGDQP